MSRKPRPKLAKRDQLIYRDFESAFKKGKRLEFIYNQLSFKFYLSEQSIQKIVLKQAKIKNEL